MRTKSTSLILLVMLFFGSLSLQGQTTVTIATGTVGAPDYHQGPIYRSAATSTYYYSRYAYLYTASELSTAGIFAGSKISEIAWYKNDATTLGTTRTNTFKIYLKNSSTSAYGQATEDYSTLLATATLVYDAAITLPGSAGWVTLKFDTPFIYTGGSLEVMTDFDQSTGSGSGSTAALDWAWRTVTERIYGSCSGTSSPTTLSSTNNSIGTLTDRRPDVQFTLLPTETDDIGATAFTSPSLGSCPGTFDIKVNVKNFGINQVDTFTVNWSLNGSPQTPVTSYQLLDTFGTSNPTSFEVTLGSQSFQGSQNYALVAWTSSPNNNLDSQAVNDTAKLTFSPSLSGTFTVGGTSPDYATITDAVSDISTFGICGPVVLDIRAGTYNESIDIPEIVGSSSTNTLTLQGAGAATTKISGQSSTTFATIGILGADYLTIKDLTIENPTTGADVWGILLTQQADYITIEACSILVPITTDADVVGIVATGSFDNDATEANNANYLTIEKCYISGGEVNIGLEGGGNAAPLVGNKIIDCILTNAYDYGIYTDDQDGLHIEGNTIGNLGATTADGIYTLGGYSYSIIGNTIDAPDWGMYVLDLNVNGLAYVASNFINNMIRSGSDYGLYLNDADSINLYHNTILGEPALYVNDHNFLDLRNNIFVSTSDQAVDFVDATTIGTMDFNLYYNNGAANLFEFGTTTYADLAAWQTAQSLDGNSVSGDPVFVSSTDLHIQGLVANDIGDISVGVSTDIDGEPRPFSPAVDVDLGADEIKILNNDAGISAINPACSGGDLQVKVVNYGALQLQSFQVNWSIDGTPQSPVAFTGTGLANFDDTLVTLGAHGLSGGQTYDLKVWTSLPNGKNDPEKSNDSLNNAVFETGMTGTYSVGNGGDFKSGPVAILALQNRGMCGDVTLSFLNGTHSDQFVVKGISKSSNSNALTLTSQNANASATFISYPTSVSGDNYAISIEDMDHVIIENLSIERFGIDNQSVAIQLENANDVIIRNNFILADSGSSASNTTGTKSAIYSSDIAPEHNLEVYGNVFSGNSNGIWIAGSMDYSTGLVIKDNVFSVGYTAIYIQNHDAPLISKNYVTRFDAGATTTYYGISLFNISGAPVIEKNEVIALNSIGYGIRLREVLSDNSNKGLVVNNMVQFNGTSTSYLYTLEANSANVRFVHNTGLVKGGTSTTSRVFYSISANGSNELVNNIFINRGKGTALYVSSTAASSLTNPDFNMLYSSGTNLAYWVSNRTDLQALKSGSGAFAKSIVVNPSFVSDENLRITDFDDVLVGSPEGITTDIDGNSRCSIPYVGAHEIAPNTGPLNVDFSVPDTIYAGGRGLFVNAALRSERKLHEWFVDGKSVSNEINLFYLFNANGTADVKLITTGCFGSDSVTKTVTIIAPFDVPVVDFTPERSKIFAGDFVNMIDLSTQAPTGWVWSVNPTNGVSIANEFGQDAVIFFSEPGEYEVCLIADNSFGTGAQVCKSKLIQVYPVSTICAGNGSSAPAGKLFDDGGAFGAYASNQNCSFLIDPCASSITAKITFWDMGDIDDELRIYNGTTEDPNTLLATFNQASINPGGSLGITANSGTMLVVWKTDAATVAEGFALEWETTPSTVVQNAGFTLADTVFTDAPAFVTSLASGAKLTTTWDMDFPNKVDISQTGDQLFYTYTQAGTFTIRQLVDGCGGMDTTDKTVVVVAPTSAPTPVDFHVNRESLTPNDILQVTDVSGNGPNDWRWEITPSAGVQFIGTQNAPVVQLTFANTGLYTLKLVASNSIGSDSIVKTNLIRVIEYCKPNSGFLSAGIGVSRVQFAGIDQSSDIGVNAYSDYTNNGQSASLELGGTYSIQVDRSTAIQSMTRKVWIDWNQDGDFNDSLELVAIESSAITESYTASIEVPVFAQTGITRMRVGAGYNNEPTGPCGPTVFGEFEDYRIEVGEDATKPVITLLGNNPETVEAGYGYSEAGATAVDVVDGNISNSIQIIGNVDTTVVGVYTLKYVVKDLAGNVSDTVVRVVNVTPDVTAPILSLNGKMHDSIAVFNTFIEPGYTAIDNPWGTVPSVTTTGAVDGNVVGDYELTYEATDVWGNKSTLTRLVTVFDSVPPVIIANNDTFFVEVFTAFDASLPITVMDNYWVDINVTTTGTVDVTKLDTYLIDYNAVDGSGNISQTVTLTVIVVDRTAPVIELVGSDVVNLARWQAYTDSAYVVTDNYYDSADLTIEMVGDFVSADWEGLYFVQYKATDPSGNVTYSIKRFIDVRGTNSVKPIQADGISAYPNPNKGQFTLQSEGVMSAGTQIIIHDALGKEVHRQAIQAASKEVEITTNGLNPGVYLVYVQDGNYPKTFKIQITR